ncbi:hypothetical protein ACN08N_00455 (plasmid) [Photobacterium leiognathi subsp. mandapamensis]
MRVYLAMYNWRVVMTLSIAYFGVQYFTFWWEWCRSLESKLLTAMYSSHDFNVLDPDFIQRRRNERIRFRNHACRATDLIPCRARTL